MFWHDIELIVITVALVFAIVFDVWMKDESALLENYVDKKEFSKNIDITDKSLMNNTIFNTKEDLLSARSYRRDSFVPRKDNENVMLKQAVYNRLGHLLYNDAFHQNIGDFNKLIHEEQDEEVYSQYSGNLVPNKSFKNFDPFKEKYDEQNSPSKSKSYSSPQLRSPVKDSKFSFLINT